MNTERESNAIDDRNFNKKIGNNWSNLIDNKYQGIKEFWRGIYDAKKPEEELATAIKKRYSKVVFSDQIVVESRIERLLSFWSVLSRK